MIWFFERQDDRLRHEIRRADAVYELVITNPDGSESVEAFEDPMLLMERSMRLRQTLLEQGWRPPGLPVRVLARP